MIICLYDDSNSHECCSGEKTTVKIDNYNLGRKDSYRKIFNSTLYPLILSVGFQKKEVLLLLGLRPKRKVVI